MCRAFLSPWYREGGLEPKDETDKPVFDGRANLGVVSLNLPMILAQSREEKRDFYEVLDYYMEVARNIHKKTYNYLANMKASTNPLGFCEGGFYLGNLKPEDKIGSVIKTFTLSFGVTALNELQRLHNGKKIIEDNSFAIETMEHINEKIKEFKEEDGLLYAIYGK